MADEKKNSEIHHQHSTFWSCRQFSLELEEIYNKQTKPIFPITPNSIQNQIQQKDIVYWLILKYIKFNFIFALFIFWSAYFCPSFVPWRSGGGQIPVPRWNLNIHPCKIGQNHRRWVFYKGMLDFVFANATML